MKILYLSCHSILEFDEIKLFTEMGHQVFSMGAYTSPGASDGKRPEIPNLPYDPHFIELTTRYTKDNLHPELVEPFDVIIVMHIPEWIEQNWPIIKHKRVIWRSIGQSIPHIEERLRPYRDEGLQVVRYSPREQTIHNNIGADAMIRFYKDPAEFDLWNGAQEQVINFSQSFKQRGKFIGYGDFITATRGLPRKVYGPNNDDLGDLNGGLLSYEEQKQAYRDNRAYFYHGTYPASYTLTIMEAMMTGIPVVSVGPGLGNGDDFKLQRTFEVPDIIVNGKNGFISDNLTELGNYLRQLLDEPALAKRISLYGRQTAIELWGKDTIKKQWEHFLHG